MDTLETIQRNIERKRIRAVQKAKIQRGSISASKAMSYFLPSQEQYKPAKNINESDDYDSVQLSNGELVHFKVRNLEESLAQRRGYIYAGMKAVGNARVIVANFSNPSKKAVDATTKFNNQNAKVVPIPETRESITHKFLRKASGNPRTSLYSINLLASKRGSSNSNPRGANIFAKSTTEPENLIPETSKQKAGPRNRRLSKIVPIFGMVRSLAKDHGNTSESFNSTFGMTGAVIDSKGSQKEFSPYNLNQRDSVLLSRKKHRRELKVLLDEVEARQKEDDEIREIVQKITHLKINEISQSAVVTALSNKLNFRKPLIEKPVIESTATQNANVKRIAKTSKMLQSREMLSAPVEDLDEIKNKIRKAYKSDRGFEGVKSKTNSRWSRADYQLLRNNLRARQEQRLLQEQEIQIAKRNAPSRSTPKYDNFLLRTSSRQSEENKSSLPSLYFVGKSTSVRSRPLSRQDSLFSGVMRNLEVQSTPGAPITVNESMKAAWIRKVEETRTELRNNSATFRAASRFATTDYSRVAPEKSSLCQFNPMQRILRRNFMSSLSVKQAAIMKPAPAWNAPAVVNKKFKEISSSDYAGKWLVLFFYPMDFTFVCPTEIVEFSERIAEFEKLNASIVGCSVDSKYSHLTWINQPRKTGGLGDLNIPLISDWKKTISKDYGVLLDAGHAARGTFIIDPKGVLRQITINDLDVGRNVTETLRLLEAAQFADEHGQVCPVGWTKGAKTMTPDVIKSKEYFSKVH